jgi:hypothetical protein
MKALSIKQPWAWLIAQGIKDVENRSWRTNFRGDFLIHASKSFDYSGMNWISSNFPEIKNTIKKIAMLVKNDSKSGFFGGIIGKGRIIDCVDSYQSPWFTGPYGFIIVDPMKLPYAACKGKLGFFDIDINVK